MHLPNTKLSTLGSAVSAFLIATLAVCAWGFWSIVENIDRSAEWGRKQLVAERKVQLASDIYRTTGYVGFIHHFKNLVLRRDLKYFDQAQASAQAAQAAIDAFAKLASGEEKTHLATIRLTLKTYTDKMLQIPELIQAGASTEALDQQVKVDDALALAAIGALIESGRRTEHEAALAITASFENTGRVIRRMVTWMSLMIGLSILLSLYGIRRVVGGMGAIAAVFRKISAGEQVGSIPGQGAPNELGELADAAEAFSQALRESRAKEAYLRATQNAAVDGLIIIDTRGTVRFFNEAAEAIFGYRRDEIMGQNIKKLMPASVAVKHDAYLLRYLDTGVKAVIGSGRTVEAQRKNGDCFPLELSVAEAKTDNEHVFVGLVRDISERVEMRRQLEMRNAELAKLNLELTSNMQALAQAQKQVLQAEKMASLGRVVGGAAHALNTPLGIAVTSSSLVRDDLLQIAGDAERDALEKGGLMRRLSRCDEALGLVDSSLSRATGLVTTLKALSQHERYDRIQKLVFPDCLHDIMSSLKQDLKSAGVSLSIESAGELVIHSYFTTLADVIHALASNAICHAFENKEEKRLVFEINPDSSSQIEIVVQDNGNGIPEDLLPSIFEPFSTLKHSQGHHGLGLYAVHTLVTGRLKGEIEVIASPSGGGTRFVLSLPDLKPDTPA